MAQFGKKVRSSQSLLDICKHSNGAKFNLLRNYMITNKVTFWQQTVTAEHHSLLRHGQLYPKQKPQNLVWILRMGPVIKTDSLNV